jgi:anti-anti-sigma regulatory factor
MKLEIKKIDGIDVIRLPVYVDKADYDILRDLIVGFAAAGQTTVMVDCRTPEKIPSVALGVFCAMGAMLHERGGLLGLVGLSEHTKGLIRTISMDKYVAMFDSLEDAIRRCAEKVE